MQLCGEINLFYKVKENKKNCRGTVHFLIIIIRGVSCSTFGFSVAHTQQFCWVKYPPRRNRASFHQYQQAISFPLAVIVSRNSKKWYRRSTTSILLEHFLTDRFFYCLFLFILFMTFAAQTSVLFVSDLFFSALLRFQDVLNLFCAG